MLHQTRIDSDFITDSIFDESGKRCRLRKTGGALRDGEFVRLRKPLPDGGVLRVPMMVTDGNNRRPGLRFAADAGDAAIEARERYLHRIGDAWRNPPILPIS